MCPVFCLGKHDWVMVWLSVYSAGGLDDVAFFDVSVAKSGSVKQSLVEVVSGSHYS
jgi:hypothetical protein